MFLKPASPNVRVRDPITKHHLKAEGEEKPESSYWLRAIRSGDVVECAPPVVVLDNQISDSAGEG